jgi:hypothetical protein
MSTMIDINQFYHRAKEKDLVRNEKARVSLGYQHTNDVGVRIHLLLDYKMANSDPRGPKRHAYAASILFKDLTKNGYDGIVKAALNSKGRNEDGEMIAVKRLLARDDVVFVTRNESLLKHPLIAHKFGEVTGESYGGGDVNNAPWEAVQQIQKEVCGPNAVEDQLFEPMHPDWVEMDKASNSSMSY